MATKKTGKGLAEFAISKIGTPYVYGAKGTILTLSGLNNFILNLPNMFTPSYISKAKKYVGQVCTDCSGLISWYTGKMMGSAQMYNSATKRGLIKDVDKAPVGAVLWKTGHVGIKIDNTYCVEAKGINYGTVKTKISATKWTHWLLFENIMTYNTPSSTPSKPISSKSFDNKAWIKKLQTAIKAKSDGIPGAETLSKTPTVKMGSKGTVVKLVQEKLNAIGYNCGKADGEIGKNSVKGMKQFQSKVVGMKNPDGEFTAKGNSWKVFLSAQ